MVGILGLPAGVVGELGEGMAGGALGHRRAADGQRNQGGDEGSLHIRNNKPGARKFRPSVGFPSREAGGAAAAKLSRVKTEIHPEYVEAHVRCTCGNEFTTRSTKPEIHVEICSACHPFYTGKQKLVDTGGRVERFQRRVAKGRRPARDTADSA